MSLMKKGGYHLSHEKIKLVGASIDDAGAHEVIQLAVVLHDEEFNPTERFVTKIRPMHPQYATDEAMVINGMSLLKLRTQPMPQQVRPLFFDWFESVAGSSRIYPLGHNYSFDKQFLEVFFGKETYKQLFHYKFRDTHILAQTLIDCGSLTGVKSTKLEILCEHFGIPHLTHDAEGDTAATLTLYRELLKLVRGGLNGD